MTTKTYSPCLGGPAIGQVHHITEIPEDDPLTIRSRTVWSSGDFDHIAQGFASGAAAFIARLGVRDQRVLDVACGTGNLALPAALAGADVTGLDIAPNLLATARRHAKEAALAIQFDEGNAEMMPYADGSFDTVVTMFGAMFAARPDCAAAELLRVTRPGGRIAMANWTPEGFIGHMLRAHVARVPPPAGVPSTLLWGKEDVVGERLGDARDVRCTRRTIALAYPCSPRGTAELFRDFYGPTVRTFAALDAEGQAQFLEELVALWTSANVATDGTTRVEAEYLEVLAVT